VETAVVDQKAAVAATGIDVSPSRTDIGLIRRPEGTSQSGDCFYGTFLLNNRGCHRNAATSFAEINRMKHFLILAILGSSLATAFAQTIVPISLYGYLDQYSLGSDSSSIGPDACVPTTTTNAFTYLQNAFPAIYGTSLSGSSYEDWKATDRTLVSLMQTAIDGGGTTDAQEVYGLTAYLDGLALGATYPVMAGIMSDGTWTVTEPRPSYISHGRPGAEFLENALLGNAALIMTLTYIGGGGGGHCLLVNGIDWNEATGTGVLYFIDPLDPSQNYDSGADPEVRGPVLQTTGTLSLGASGDLNLTYNQYHGVLPYEGGNFVTIDSYIDGALALYAVPEPATVVLIGMGVLLGGLSWSRRYGRPLA